MYFYIAKLLPYNWTLGPVLFDVFLIVCDVTCDTLVTSRQLSKNVLRQNQVMGYANLAPV